MADCFEQGKSSISCRRPEVVGSATNSGRHSRTVGHIFIERQGESFCCFWDRNIQALFLLVLSHVYLVPFLTSPALSSHMSSPHFELSLLPSPYLSSLLFFLMSSPSPYYCPLDTPSRWTTVHRQLTSLKHFNSCSSPYP